MALHGRYPKALEHLKEGWWEDAAHVETLCALVVWRDWIDQAADDPRHELAFQTQLGDSATYSAKKAAASHALGYLAQHRTSGSGHQTSACCPDPYIAKSRPSPRRAPNGTSLEPWPPPERRKPPYQRGFSISGRTVQVGLPKRFSGCLRSHLRSLCRVHTGLLRRRDPLYAIPHRRSAPQLDLDRDLNRNPRTGAELLVDWR